MAVAATKPPSRTLVNPTFSVAELGRLIAGLKTRYDGDGASKPSEGPSRPTTMHGLMRWRRESFHALRAADPFLPPPYDKGPRFQSDLPRQKHSELKGRLLENPVVIKVRPQAPTEALKKLADSAEQVLNVGLNDLLERLGLDLAGRLADGVIIDGQAFVHWRYDKTRAAEMGEAEERDELPEDSDLDDVSAKAAKAEERGRYEEAAAGGKKYRETAKSRMERHKLAKARAGLPFWIEAPDPQSVYVLEDQGSANGFAMAVRLREVPLLDYTAALRTDRLYLSLHDVNAKIAIYEEKDKPADWLLTGAEGYPQSVEVAHVWTRDECYEIARAAGEWEVVKSWAVQGGMPPFARAVGVDNGSPDPALRYEPALEGVFRTKELYDRGQSLYLNLAEITALPFAYKRLADGTFAVTDDGKSRMRLSRNAADSMTLAPGEEIVWSEFTVGEAFVRSLEYLRQIHAESAPPTGKAEINAQTQPWSALLGQQQESVSPARLASHIASAYRVMVRSMVECLARKAEEGGHGESVAVLIDGKAVEIEPEQWRSLIVDVSVSPKSAAERVTTTELYASLAERGHPILDEQIVEDGLGVADASEHLAAFNAQKMVKLFQPGLAQQKLAAYFGRQFVLGSDMQAVGMGGAPADDEAVLAANGVRPAVPGLGTKGEMRALPDLRAPGAVPQQGRPG